MQPALAIPQQRDRSLLIAPRTHRDDAPWLPNEVTSVDRELQALSRLAGGRPGVTGRQVDLDRVLAEGIRPDPLARAGGDPR